MVETDICIDFVTVDGAEGGTGAAPAEFTDHLGCPLRDALVYVDNTFKGASLRDRVKIAASGKIVSGYDIISAHIALGADWCNMARPFMFALGCIQARDCASGECPTGISHNEPKTISRGGYCMKERKEWQIFSIIPLKQWLKCWKRQA